MRAIVVPEFGPPDVMQVRDVPRPVAGPGEVVIRVHAAGVNPVETYIRAGVHARKPTLPYIPGTDLSGIVEAAGSDVEGLSLGARVYAFGTAQQSGAYAEVAVCEAHQVRPLPSHLTFSQGAALGIPYSTAWRALFVRADGRPGETVLVHGASGGVGTAAVQMARTKGLTVIGTAGTDAGLEVVRRAGAHAAVNHREGRYLDRVMELTNDRGADVIIEMLANVNLDRDLDIVAVGGRIVVIGNRGRVEIDPRKLMIKDAAVLGMSIVTITPEELTQIHGQVATFLEASAAAPIIGCELDLGEAAVAHRTIIESGARGKIVLLP